MATLGDVERLTKEFADARERLGATLRDLNDRIEMLKRQFLPGVKTCKKNHQSPGGDEKRQRITL